MPEPSVNITVRLPRALVEHIDFQAHAQRLTRAEWLRNAIRAYYDAGVQRAHLEGVEKRLSTQLERMQRTILQHVTAEIDNLTRE